MLNMNLSLAQIFLFGWKVSTSLLFDEKKRIKGFKQFLRDITPLKQANLNLKDLNAELANLMYKAA